MSDIADKFRLKDPCSGQMLPNFDYHLLLIATDEEFGMFYLAQMKRFEDSGVAWEDNPAAKCSLCEKTILSPSQMRRYYCKSLHPECFSIERSHISPEQKLRYEPTEEVRKYTDRVEHLVL